MRRCVHFRIPPEFLATLLAGTMGLAQQPAPSGSRAVNTGAKHPKITEVQVRAPLQGDAKGAGFTLAILGENLCTPGEKPAVEFLVNGKTTEAAKSTQCESPTELLASGELAAPFEITEVRLVLPGSVVRSKGYKVSIRPNPPAPKLNEFQIKFEHQKNKEFPNLHSVVVTKESGEPGVGFDVNPNHMQIELVPTGCGTQ